MKFIDEAIIEVHAGKGADGMVSFCPGYLALARRCPAPKPATGAFSR
jgi:hypothetical protein